jgi:hypothetical protein
MTGRSGSLTAEDKAVACGSDGTTKKVGADIRGWLANVLRLGDDAEPPAE